jgi:ABC-type phosphate transport system substrate-binding protein
MKKITIIITLLFAIIGGDTLYGQVSMNAVTIIGNKTGFSSNSAKEIKQVFRGKYANWSTREQVIIVLPASKSSSAEIVASVVYGNTVSGVQKYWLSLVFQGRSNPPVFLDTDEEIISYVKRTSGSIGVISSGNQKVPGNLIISINN